MNNHVDNTPGTMATCARCGATIRWNENGGWMDPTADAGAIARCKGRTTLHYALTALEQHVLDCHFCGTEVSCHYCGNVLPIHPESITQTGEPLCHACFNDSVTPDPTNDEQYANSPDDLYSDLYATPMETYTVLVHVNLTVQAKSEAGALVEARFYNTVHGIAGDVAHMEVI